MKHEQLWVHCEYFSRPGTHAGIEYPYFLSQCRVIVRRYRLAHS
jgi:hypothetical protein